MTFLLHRLLTEAAQSDPDREAVRFGGRAMTFGELERASNSIAHCFLDAGIRRGDRVALLVNKGFEQVAAVHGILKAGAAYVPLDVMAPVQRNALIVRDTEPSAIVTTPSRAHGLLAAGDEAAPPRLLILSPEAPGEEEGDADVAGDAGVPRVPFDQAAGDRNADPPDVGAVELDLACLLYTSGSTGAPKGAMLSHRNGLSLSEWWVGLSKMSPEDRELGFSPLQFVASINDLFATIMGRATLVLLPERDLFSAQALGRALQDERITLWMGAPPIFMILLKGGWAPGSFPSVRACLWGGSVFPPKHVRALQQLVPNARLRSMLGSTEACQVTVYDVEEVADDDQPIPIGRPCANVDVYALKEDGSVAGPGEEGRVHVRSASVFKGYWRDPEKTAGALIRDPLRPDFPDVVYRSGDLVRKLPDGNYVFVGRTDQMIKTRGGFRVEPAEIEAAINLHPSVLEGAVIPVPHATWGHDIVAYVQPQPGADVSETDLKAHVGDRLPKYMVPRRIEVVDELPRTAAGKVARQALLERETARPPDGSAVA